MSQGQTSPGGQVQAPAAVADPLVEFVKGVGWFVVVVVLAPVALPLVVPSIALQAMIVYGPTKARYWLVPRWWVGAVVGGLVAVAGITVWEISRLAVWGASGQARTYFTGGFGAWASGAWGDLWPWLVVNVAAGVFLIPAAWALARRRMARQIYARQLDDVVRLEQIERARSTAADWTAAKRAGVRMKPRSGEFAKTRRRPRLTGPREVGRGAWAVGLVARPTIRTWRERTADRRRVADWIDAAERWFVLPTVASAVRALVLAESGTGKTVLLTLIIRAAVAMGWPVVMIDAKGDPADARQLAKVLGAGADGKKVVIRPPWDMFSGTADDVTAKLMRLLPPPTGANQHYTDEARGILGMIQAHAPVRSVEDLRKRLQAPAAHVRTEDDADQINAVVDSRTMQTAGGRVWKSLSVALQPIEPYIAAGGWTYDKPGADVVVVPLTPVHDAHARLGDLMLMDLRQWMAARLDRGDKKPALLVIDEFPQLVTGDVDPGDMAAALFETARSAGLGLILAGQSPAGVSRDEATRARAMTSGAALIIGRSKSPEDVVKLAGTVMRMEASGEAHTGELRSGRAQHAYMIPPQEVREAWNGRFWIINSGAIASVRVLPPAPARQSSGLTMPASAEVPAAKPAPVAVERAELGEVPADVDHGQAPDSATVEAPPTAASRARKALRAAQRAHLQADERLTVARGRLADAEGAVRVAQARHDELTAEGASAAKIVAAEEAVSKAVRAVEQHREVIENRQAVRDQAARALEEAKAAAPGLDADDGGSAPGEPDDEPPAPEDVDGPNGAPAPGRATTPRPARGFSATPKTTSERLT